MSLKPYYSLIVESPESGSFKNSDDAFSGLEWTRVYGGRAQYASTIVKNIEPNEHDQDDQGYLKSFALHTSSVYFKLSLVYTSTQSAGKGIGSGVLNTPQYFLQWVEDDIPLSQLVKYLANWDHVLAAKNETTGDFTKWASATTTELSKEDGAKFHWYKDTSQIPVGWYEKNTMQKPGVERRLNYRATIRELVWCNTPEQAEKFACVAVNFVAPAKSYGIGSGHWLKVPSTISPQGSLFQVETLFINSPKPWDNDVYGSELK